MVKKDNRFKDAQSNELEPVTRQDSTEYINRIRNLANPTRVDTVRGINLNDELGN